MPLVTFYSATGQQIGEFSGGPGFYSAPYADIGQPGDVDMFGDPEILELSNRQCSRHLEKQQRIQ